MNFFFCFLLSVNGYFACLCVNRGQGKALDRLGLELQALVGHRVGAGNRSLLLYEGQQVLKPRRHGYSPCCFLRLCFPLCVCVSIHC